MAFTGNYMCTSFKKELMQGIHNLSLSGGNTFKMALYTDAATLDATTTAYTASNEVSGTGYAAPGKNLTNVNPLTSGTTAYAEFGDQTWTTSTITARGALMQRGALRIVRRAAVHATGSVDSCYGEL